MKDNGHEAVLDVKWGRIRGAIGDFLDFYKTNCINDGAIWWGGKSEKVIGLGNRKKNSTVT